jgi:LacI family transcriptional regulator
MSEKAPMDSGDRVRSSGGLVDAASGPPRTRVRASSKAPIRLLDVAKLAGVSSGTVSRVLNQPEMVSPAARTAVIEAIDKLGWVPHGPARALASHKTRTIGAIIPNLANPVFAEMIYAIQDRLMAAGYTLIIGCSEYAPENALREARAMVSRGIDGLVLLGENYPDALWTLLAVQRVPYLIAYSFRRGSERCYVGFDNDQSARLTANYLLDLGHRHFAIVTQEVAGNDRAAARLQGFTSALAERGISLAPDQVVQKPWSIREGHAAFAELVRSGQRPTAVICGNDYLAAGVLAACHEHGIRVPEDMSVVGFDDLEIAAYLSPPLTTVRVPAAEVGTKAAAVLLDRIVSNEILKSIELQPELVIRRSTGPPKAAAAKASTRIAR